MTSTTTAKQTWVIDPAHSEITFKIKHLAISTVTGKFKKFDAHFEEQGDDLTTATISFEADANSIDTNQEQRDTHLKSEDFFGAEANPKIRFTSTSIEKAGGSHYKVHGNLEIKGVSKPIVLDAEHEGTAVDPYKNKKQGFSLTGKLNRKDFGLTWNAVTETGGFLVSDEVKIDCSVQFQLKA